MNQFPRSQFPPTATARRFAPSLTLAIAIPFCIVTGAGATSSAETKVIDPLQVMTARGCTACHIIPGIPSAQSKLGPTLKGLSARKRIVARTLTNNEKNLRRWLKNPKKVKTDTLMPNVGLTDDEIDALIVYFGTL